MHITKTTKDATSTTNATVAIEYDPQGLKVKLKERILSIATDVDDIVEEIYNQGFRDGLAEGKERTEQELDSAVNNAFANGQNDARATACRLARLKEAGLLFTDMTFEDIFRHLSPLDIEKAVDAYYTQQNELKEKETQAERDMRNTICALYSQFGKEAVTKMWDSINAEGVATIPEPLPFD